jgi:hypothetical protein
MTHLRCFTIVGIALATVALVSDGALAQSKCNPKRHGVAAKLGQASQKCTQKAEKKNSDPEPCITDARGKAEGKWDKASKSGDCEPASNFIYLESTLTAFRQAADRAAHGGLRVISGGVCCQGLTLPTGTPNPSCTATVDEAQCVSNGGTVMPGICSAGGTCQDPGVRGDCCNPGAGFFPCTMVDASACSSPPFGVGTPKADAVCTASGCVAEDLVASVSSKCDAKRHGVAAKLVQKTEKCVGKAEKKGENPADCLSDATSKATGKWDKAAKRGDCAPGATFEDLLGAVTDFQAGAELAVHGLLVFPGGACCGGIATGGGMPPVTCSMVPQSNTGLCTPLGSIQPGACSADGTCTMTPTIGDCCDGGPGALACGMVDPATCVSGGLTPVPDAICTPVGCRTPPITTTTTTTTTTIPTECQCPTVDSPCGKSAGEACYEVFPEGGLLCMDGASCVSTACSGAGSCAGAMVCVRDGSLATFCCDIAPPCD